MLWGLFFPLYHCLVYYFITTKISFTYRCLHIFFGIRVTRQGRISRCLMHSDSRIGVAVLGQFSAFAGVSTTSTAWLVLLAHVVSYCDIPTTLYLILLLGLHHHSDISRVLDALWQFYNESVAHLVDDSE